MKEDSLHQNVSAKAMSEEADKTSDEQVHSHVHLSCCAHGEGHHHACTSSAKLWIWPAVSLVLLVSGMVMSAAGMSCFDGKAFCLLWFVAAYLPVGLPVMCEAWQAMRARDYFNEFSLMLLASVGAFCIGEYPEAVAVMLFYTIGETLQHKAVDRASRNISKLLDVRPEHAYVLRGSTYVSVSPRQVRVGEQIEVKPGDRVPLDGVLLESEALFDTSALTGESLPQARACGEDVLAGMIVSDQAIHLRVTHPYDQSTLARILELVRDAAGRKAPAELFIRKFARVYTPVVILLALLIVLMPALVAVVCPSYVYVFPDWLYRGLVFLVISCPCALVISVPLGYFAGIGAASRVGILCKGGNYLDAIARVNCIAFDKTGTLTSGQFQVKKVHTEGSSADARQLLSAMRAVEEKSTHPIAQAIVAYAREQEIPSMTVSEVHEVPGLGVEAMAGGRRLSVGNIRLMKRSGVRLPSDLLQESGTLVVCAVDGQYAGAVSLVDGLKPDAASAISALRSLCITDICLLSGDKKEIVDQIARDLGIEQAYGELLPSDKAAYVERWTQIPGKSVAFVGDGMNDAPVLALSHVGIAMGGLGSDAAIESADIVIQTDQPSKVATAVRIGRFTRRIVLQNIVGTIAVKVMVLLAGVCGVASLWGAVFADVGVALLAVLNAMRVSVKRFA